MEVELEDGSKIKFEVSGNNLEKVRQFINFIDSLYINDSSQNKLFIDESTIFGRIYNLILKEFGLSSFSLSELYKAYLIKYGEDIKKSTLSTYLSRLIEQGYLRRIGYRGKYRYKLISSLSASY